jgi:hypothetical protein
MGTWALGTKKDCQNLIEILTQIQEDFHGLVGDDEVYNGLDIAISRVLELQKIARNE